MSIVGGIGALVMADASQKVLGVAPIALFFAGIFAGYRVPSRTLSTIYLVALALEISGAVLGMLLFQRARLQKMKRAIEGD